MLWIGFITQFKRPKRSFLSFGYTTLLINNKQLSNYLLYLYKNMILLITNVSNATKLMRREVQVKGESLIMQQLYHRFNREENSVYRCEMTEIQQ